MSVYVDKLSFRPDVKSPGARFLGKKFNNLWSHLWADTEQELMEFAVKIMGMKPEWLQRSNGGILHFDLVPPRRAKAIKLGALERPNPFKPISTSASDSLRIKEVFTKSAAPRVRKARTLKLRQTDMPLYTPIRTPYEPKTV